MSSRSAILSLLLCAAIMPIGVSWGQDTASVLDQAFYAILDYDGEPDSPSVRVIRNEVTAAKTSITKRIGLEVKLFEVLESSLSTDAARAFDGYMDLMLLPADRSDEETQVVYQTAVDLALTPARVNRVAQALTAIGTPLAEDMLMLLPQPETDLPEADAPLVLDVLDD